MLKRRWLILLGLVSIITVLSLYVIPVNFFFHKQALPAPELKKYAYYQIIDEATGQTLMYVPIAVSLDDELVSETNKRY
ncbi:MAG: hypothetical protein H6Q75_1108, partial [Firmicutes bacterium]|nr:hypothetical protein [Bacillota bacterium]